MNPTILIWIALITAALVFWHARRTGNAHPYSWAAAIFLAWIIALPLYLWRTKYRRVLS